MHIGDKKKKASKRRKKARAQPAQHTTYTHVATIPAPLPPPPAPYMNRPQFFDPTTQADRERHQTNHPLFGNTLRGNQQTFFDPQGRESPVSVATEVRPYTEDVFGSPIPKHPSFRNEPDYGGGYGYGYDQHGIGVGNIHPPTPPHGVSFSGRPSENSGFEEVYSPTSANTSAFQDTNPMNQPMETDTFNKFSSDKAWKNRLALEKFMQDQRAQIEKANKSREIAAVVGSGSSSRAKRVSDEAYNERRRSARLAEKAEKERIEAWIRPVPGRKTER